MTDELGYSSSICTITAGMNRSTCTRKIARRSGNRYPVAANMARMNYDCGLEAQALSYARQCPYMKSTSANAGENFSRFPASGLYTWADVVNKTVTSWWSVVNINSTGVDVNAV
ncbi:hypothetical protein OESDEN_23058, partial [Oesophagostomum dentatum]